jgi:hypothetical protein
MRNGIAMIKILLPFQRQRQETLFFFMEKGNWREDFA